MMAWHGRLETLLKKNFPAGTTCQPLKGDASTRRFYRIVPPGEPPQILMAYPDPFDWDEFPLRFSHEHFRRIGVPVAEILDLFPAEGMILVEDLGDTTLQDALVRDPSLDRGALYREAIDIIVRIQTRGTGEMPAASPLRRIALDEERFRWELDHFRKHFLLGFCAARPAPEEEELLHHFSGWLSVSLDRAERVLCHRDFQSRNLMITPAGLRVIDHQDARMGPASYDLASLLRDSSLDLEEDLAEEGIRYFLAGRRGLGDEEFREEFGRMALQRNLKDLGTFGYQVHALGRDEYRAYIPRTVRMVRENLLRHRRYHEVFPVFEKLVFSRAAG